VLLAALLVSRIVLERRRQKALVRMGLVEFSDFLRSNSVEGNIQTVAGKVSTLLSKSFGCERIIFLRKKRGTLELNFYYGLKNFNRRDFELPFGTDLAVKLSRDFLPVKIASVEAHLPQKFFENLVKQGVDIYFPIYWRSNLYGVYFVMSNKATRSPEFALLIASMAHSLSAAYHIKWHESRLGEVEKRADTSKKISSAEIAKSKKAEFSTLDMLPLLKIKDAELLVPQIMEKVGERLSLDKFAYAYRRQGDSKEPKQLERGLKEKLGNPESEVIGQLCERLKGRGPQLIADYKDNDPSAVKYLSRLRQHGLEFIASFPLTEKDEGLLAWSGKSATREFQTELSSFQKIAGDLIENAEAYQQAEMMSYTDALTGLSNQRYMYKRLEEEVNRARRYNRPLAFIIFDIDELKGINDNYGHQAGDALLRQVGLALKKSIRAIDIVARYGGDEFCVVMPESDEETCVKFMQRILDTIASTKIELDRATPPIFCSVSMGGALFPQHAKETDKLVYAADMALLSAKEKGRNRFIVYSALEAAREA